MMNPEYSHPNNPVPLVDYCDIESGFLKRFPSWINSEPYPPVSEIPFQIFAYRVMEREKCISYIKDTSESGSEVAYTSGDEHVTTANETLISVMENKNPKPDEYTKRRLSLNNRSPDARANKYPGMHTPIYNMLIVV